MTEFQSARGKKKSGCIRLISIAALQRIEELHGRGRTHLELSQQGPLKWPGAGKRDSDRRSSQNVVVELVEWKEGGYLR